MSCRSPLRMLGPSPVRMPRVVVLPILATLLIFSLGVSAVRAQTPVVEMTNSGDEALFRVFEDGSLLGLDAAEVAGTLPAAGAGTRLLWYPEAAAFRAGRVEGTQWDEGSLGVGSVAFGENTSAAGDYSFAAGSGSVASSIYSVAIGEESFANSNSPNGGAVAIGEETRATGRGALALGWFAEAPSTAGVAIGYKAHTDPAGQQGGMALNAEYTAGGPGLTAIGTGQFAVRARHYWFGDDENVERDDGRFLETSTGAHLTDGGTWTNASDSTKKEHYRAVGGEALLEALREVPVRTWSYEEEPDDVRHMGPTAQDFRAAFGLGDGDEAITTVDIAGVNMRAVQALDARARALRQRNEVLEARVTKLEAALRRDGRLRAGVGDYATVVLFALALAGGVLLRRRRPSGA